MLSLIDFKATMKSCITIAYELVDKGLVPDFVVRIAIRSLLRQRLREIDHGSLENNHAAKMRWIEEVRTRDSIAEKTQEANEQHYEVPTEFILSCLGARAKYSPCLYLTGSESLDEAEVLMLERYCQRAQLRDGMEVLDLGCGWGSLTLYLAEKYPNSRLVGMSNSRTQRQHILAVAERKGLKNVTVITADINAHDFPETQRFDRILTIGMFEHMKNYETLLEKVSSWLRPTKGNEENSLLFVHIFVHRTTPYHFEDSGGWMSQMFFSGGTMPSHDMLLYFQNDLSLVRSWYNNGKDYARTSEDWLRTQDKNKKLGLEILEKDAVARGLSKEEGTKIFYRFRVFYMACAELFAMNRGDEWGEGDYLFTRKRR